MNALVTDLLAVLAAGVTTAAATMTVTAWTARRAGRVSVVDTAWGIGLTLVSLVSVLLGQELTSASLERGVLLVALAAVWGLRLSWHVHRRNADQGEDPRYAAMLAGASRWEVFRRVWLTQGAALCLVSLPVQVAAVSTGSWAWWTFLGVGVWLLGFVFESVGDAQLAAFMADPAHRGSIMDRGLWSWTRHPNYFGDACVWWGIWLAALTSWWGWLTVVAPVAMTWFLVFVTGARPLEQHMASRPGWAEYAARTSMFVPLPQRPPGVSAS